MEAALFVYFAGMVGELANAFNGLFVIFLGLSFFGSILGPIWVNTTYSCTTYLDENDEAISQAKESKNRMAIYKKYIPKIFAVAIVCKFTSVLIPEEKTVWYMAGAYVGQQALQSEIASDVYEIIKHKVKEQKNIMLKEVTK